MIHIYSDGATQPNPGKGAYGVVIIYPSGQIAQHCGYLGDNVTNNFCELTGFIEGLRRVDPKSEVTFHLDSRYVLDSIAKGWVYNWKKNNWKTAKGTPVANKELWIKALEIIKGRNISYNWVKGHSGNEYNELADQLANIAIKTREVK
jgi:ribonuclease HI